MNSITLYQPGNSIFHRCDSRTKLVLILCFAIPAFLFFNPLMTLILALVALILNIIATKTYALTSALAKFLLIMSIFFVVLHGFVNPLGESPAVFWGHHLTLPFFGTYTLEGAYVGLTFIFRIAAIALIVLLYISTTPPAEVINGLIKMHLPFSFGFMILMSLQLIPISIRETNTIISAQRARGLVERNLWQKIKALLPLFVPLVINSLQRMETLAMALEARGFGYTEHPTQLLYEVRFTKKDAIIITGGIGLLVISLMLYFEYGRLSWIDQIQSWGSIFWPY